MDTTTIIFTDTPVTSITNRATLFSEAAFQLAESPSNIVDATEQIRDAEDAGDIQGVMETQDVSERTAYRRTQNTRKRKKATDDAKLRMSAEILLAENGSQTKNARALGISRGKLRQVLGI